jgi:hypothetical protein
MVASHSNPGNWLGWFLTQAVTLGITFAFLVGFFWLAWMIQPWLLAFIVVAGIVAYVAYKSSDT